MAISKSLTILQMNDSHAYLDLHQELFWNGDHTKYLIYTTAFVTSQGILDRYGFDRKNLDIHAVEGLRKYLATQSPVDASLRGTFIAV